MIRSILVILICFFSICVSAQVVEDANASVRPVTGSFEKINISGNVKVIISQSSDIAVAVSASEIKYKDDIRMLVKYNTLFISVDDNRFWKSRGKGYTVYLSLKILSEINASGAADIIVAGTIEANQMEITLAGASSFKGSLQAEKLKMEMSGASDAKLYGKAADFEITCNGASDINSYEFITQNCTANASGASDMQLSVQQNLQATASGASHIFYKGDVANTGLHANGVSKILKEN